jgi:hypothetical protein
MSTCMNLTKLDHSYHLHQAYKTLTHQQLFTSSGYSSRDGSKNSSVAPKSCSSSEDGSSRDSHDGTEMMRDIVKIYVKNARNSKCFGRYG